jgi:hypothetical protein
MKLLGVKALAAFFLATVLTAPAWGVGTAIPGSINYVEGQVNLADQPLDSKSVGSAELQPGQTLTTGNGKAEILLTPGVFLRVGDNSTVQMVSTNLTNTEADLVKGQATVEVAEIHQYNQLRIGEDGATTELLKDGLYAFDADQANVLVVKGEAQVQDNDQNVKVKAGHELDLSHTGKLKTVKYDKNAFEASDLYRFSDLRSAYLAEANVDIARQYYAGGPGWYGPGWYWDPGFWSYTWLPGDGIFYSPFGWGFYSPWWVGYAPVYYGHYPYRGSYGFRNYARSANLATIPRAQPGHVMPAPHGNFGVTGPSFRGGSMSGGGFARGEGFGGGFHGGGFSGGHR